GGQRAGGRGRGGDAEPFDAGSTSAPAASAQQRVSPGVTAGRPAGSDQWARGDARAGGQFRGGGQGGGRGAGRGPGGGDDADRRARAMERFKSMPPDEQTQFIGRMKDHGQDVTAFEQARTAKALKKAATQPKYGAAQSG